MSRQMTFAVNGQRIRIVARRKTSMGNPVGFAVRINDKLYHVLCLTYREAMDQAYVRWVKEQPIK